MKIKFKKVALLSLLLVLVFALLLVFLSEWTSVQAEELEKVVYEQKIYSHATIDDDFDDSSVIVVMDKKVGGFNVKHKNQFFGNLKNIQVEDLTYFPGDIDSYKYLDKENFRQILKITLPNKSKENVLKTISQLEKIDGIKYIGPNYINTPFAEEGPLPENWSPINQDVLWNLYGEHGIKARNAWSITTGNHKIKVGVIDSGIVEHSNLDGNLNAGLGRDFYNTAEPDKYIATDDPWGHGTAVAGIIGANGKGTSGIVGVCWDVQLIPLQVVFWYVDNKNPKKTGWSFEVAAIVQAIKYAIECDLPILNYSGGKDIMYDSVKSAIQNYKGVFITAAGNDGLDIDDDKNKQYPADFADETNPDYAEFSNRVITVGATTESGDLWEESNYGINSVNIYAPGAKIYTTYPEKLAATEYEIVYGTSFAAPHVAGVAALMLSVVPNLTAAQIKSIIIESADPIADTPYKKLNAYKAVKAVKDLYITNAAGDTIIRADSSLSGTVSIPEEILGVPIKAIGASAFSGCKGIESVIIPYTVTSIAVNAFANCSNLTNISVNYFNTIYKSEDNCIIQKSDNALVLGCKSSVIPNYVTAIGAYAFYNCSGLTSVTIPTSVTSIGSYAFSGCKGLTDVKIPSSVTSIGDDAFSGCTGLTSIAIPSSVASIGDFAFSGCTGLKGLTISNGVKSIGMGAFSNCIGLIGINIPPSVTSIGDSAFRECMKLAEVYISSSIKNIASYTFSGCIGLRDISLPPSITSIDSDAFSDCTGLRNISLPSSIKNIGSYAFSGCSGLRDISLPSSIISIGSYAFSGCSDLRNISLPPSITSIGSYAFSGCGLTSVNIPASVTSIAGSVFANCPLTSITVSPNNEMLKSDGNCIINRKTNALVLGCSTSVIPNYTWAILKEAFYGCNGLTQINIPNSVIFIGDYAFAGCTNISKISIPSSVRGVGAYAFKDWKSTQTIYCSIDIQLATSVWDKNWLGGCNAKVNYNDANDYSKFNFTLQGDGYVISGKPEYANEAVFLTIPSYYNGYPVKQIRAGGFSDFVNLREVKFLPDSQLEVIGFNAFYGCSSLNRINIPSTVKRIEIGAFLECYELRSLILPSSILEINSMAFGANSPTYSITIYVDVEFAPQGGWVMNNPQCYVYWDCTFVGDYEYVESIVVQPDNSGLINEPYRDRYMVYWGPPAYKPYTAEEIMQGVVPAGTRLFAYWIDAPVFMSLLGIDDIELLPEGWWENLDWLTPEMFEQFTWDMAS